MNVKSLLTKALLFASSIAFAQEAQLTPTDTLAKAVTAIKDDISLMKKLKFSGWVQTQFQLADQTGIETYAGGSNFNANVDDRFSVRRGRLKAIYDNGFSLYNIQIDISERNVQIREMFVKLSDHKWKAFRLTTGIFNRPFGYEISQSSSVRETPERARMSQTLFFTERDLGTWLQFQAPTSSKFHFLKLDAAVVSGTGITNVNNLGASVADASKNTQNNTSGGNDFDFQKDFIGRISGEKTNKSQKVTVSGGLSYYYGGYRTGNKQIWKNSSSHAGFDCDSSLSNVGTIVKRIHYGADFQLTIDNPLGLTTLRGEFIMGQMPGLGYRTYNSTPYSQPLTPIYYRNFNGAYFYFVQRFGKSKHTIVVKYDWYDPNVNVKGTQIGAAGSNTSATDVRFDTWGFGYLYNLDANVKLSVYYDMVKNESTLISNADPRKDFSKDIKDNVLTLRIQYKF